jgi:hypothetical protein
VLQIKQKLHIHLPHVPKLRSHSLQFSKLETENDELITAIDEEISENDDNWQLVERPDTKQLVQFWEKVEDDVQHDPKWIQVDE